MFPGTLIGYRLAGLVKKRNTLGYRLIRPVMWLARGRKHNISTISYYYVYALCSAVQIHVHLMLPESHGL